jgi:nicotinate-nucleotide adenylyltransferase
MPAGRPPHREIECDPGPRERLRLCELAAAEAEGVEASRYEIDKPGPAYTFETLEALREEHRDDDFVFIAGADQAAKLPSWREPERVLELARFAVAERPGTSRDEVLSAAASVAGGGDRVSFFAMPQIGVSSSDIRARVAEGRPYRLLVPDAVADRIEEASLYRTAAVAGAGR